MVRNVADLLRLHHYISFELLLSYFAAAGEAAGTSSTGLFDLLSAPIRCTNVIFPVVS